MSAIEEKASAPTFWDDTRAAQEMMQKAALLNINEHVYFLGLRQDVPRLLKASDCFVLSSRREGLPGAVIEAIAAGLPVIATDLPGVREIAEFTKQIHIVPQEDARSLSNAILGYLSNPGHTDMDTFPQAFDLNTCADSFYKVYTSKLCL